MNRVELKHIPLRPPNPFAGWQRKVHRLLLVLFVGSVALDCLRLWLPIPRLPDACWPDGLLLVLAAATTLASLARHLPAQNVVLAAVAIGGFAGMAETLNALTGIPFGPLVYNTENFGRPLFNLLPWPVPLIWVVAILNCRGVARLILRPWRQRASYGFWVIGLTVLMVVLFDCSLEPYATAIQHYWSWKPTRISSDWYTSPWVNFLGWAVTTLVILLFVTPALINKSPLKAPPTYEPLLIWQLLGLLFLTGAASHRLWMAVSLDASQIAPVFICWVWIISAGTLACRRFLRPAVRNSPRKPHRPFAESRLDDESPNH